MNSEWQSFLSDTIAQIKNDNMYSFFSPQQEEKTTITALSHLGLIQIGGEDATGFLQNQFTNDVSEVTETSSQISAWCSPKGRALTCFRLFKTDKYYYMQLPHVLVQPTLERLDKYRMMSKVTLEDSSDELPALGISGHQAEEILNKLLGASPARINKVLRQNDCTLLKIPGSFSRFMIFGEPAKLIRLWSSISTEAQPTESSYWRLLDIEAGLPNVYPETIEAFVPQMLNLQAVDGLSFTKGCYPGQEVVARMEYLGKLKRRMYRALVNTDTLPEPGDILCVTESGRNTGKVVDAHLISQDGYELLAVIEIASVEANEKICLENNNKAILEFMNLPYSVEQEKKQ